MLIPLPATNAPIALAFEKNTLPEVVLPLSITFEAYNPIQFNEEILFEDNKFAPVNEPPGPDPVTIYVAVILVAVILFALIKSAPVIEPPVALPYIAVTFIVLAVKLVVVTLLARIAPLYTGNNAITLEATLAFV